MKRMHKSPESSDGKEHMIKEMMQSGTLIKKQVMHDGFLLTNRSLVSINKDHPLTMVVDVLQPIDSDILMKH